VFSPEPTATAVSVFTVAIGSGLNEKKAHEITLVGQERRGLSPPAYRTDEAGGSLREVDHGSTAERISPGALSANEACTAFPARK